MRGELKMRERPKKTGGKWIILCFAIILVLLTLVGNNALQKEQVANTSHKAYVKAGIGDVVEQRIVVKRPIEGFFVEFVLEEDAEYTGNAVVTLEEGSETLAEWPIDFSKMGESNSVVRFPMPRGASKSTGESLEYNIKVEFLNSEEECPALEAMFIDPSGQQPYLMKINGREELQQLSCGVIAHRMPLWGKFAPMVFLSAVIVAFAIFALRNRKIRLEGATALILAGIGLPLILSMPPACGFDIEYHFDSAYLLSNKMMGLKDWDIRYDPELQSKVYQIRSCDQVMRLPRYKTQNLLETYEVVDRDFFRLATEEERAPVIKDQAQKGTPFYIYLPTAIGFTLARWLHLSGIGLVNMGRLINYLVYLLLSCTAIKIMPRYKETLFVTALMPGAVIQAMTLSRDNIILGLSFMSLASCMQLRKQFNSRNTVLAAVWIILLMPCKLIYVPFALLLIWALLPHVKEIDPKMKMILMASAAAALLVFLWFAGTTVWGIIKEVPSASVGSSQEAHTIMEVFRNPIRFLRIVMYTVMKQATYWLYNAIAVYDIDLGLISLMAQIPLFALILVMLPVDNAGDGKITRQLKDPWTTIRSKDRIWMTVIVLSVIGLMLIAAFLWTPSSQVEIIGVQGRYFTPILPLLGLMIASNKWISLKHNPNNFVVAIMGIVDFFMVCNMYLWVIDDFSNFLITFI